MIGIAHASTVETFEPTTFAMLDEENGGANLLEKEGSRSMV